MSRNSHAVGQQRVTVTPSTADQAIRYVKSAVGRGSGLAGWIRSKVEQMGEGCVSSHAAHTTLLS